MVQDEPDTFEDMLILSLQYPNLFHVPKFPLNISKDIPWEHLYEKELIKCENTVRVEDERYIGLLQKHLSR